MGNKVHWVLDVTYRKMLQESDEKMLLKMLQRLDFFALNLRLHPKKLSSDAKRIELAHYPGTQARMICIVHGISN